MQEHCQSDWSHSCIAFLANKDEMTPMELNQAVLSLLQKVPILERLDLPRLKVVAAKFHHHYAKAGEIIIEENDMDKELYIIVQGKVIVSKASAYGQQKIAQLGPADFFGEIALLKNVPRTARVTAEENSHFIVLTAHDFMKFYEEFPPAIRDDMQLIIQKRIEEMHIKMQVY